MTSILVKRPVAFRIPRMDAATAGTTASKTEWRYFTDEATAHYEAEQLGLDCQGLYVRDGTAIVAEWQTIDTAPNNGAFLACAVGDARGAFIVNARILQMARKSDTPSHLSLSNLTHWMPLPDPPALTPAESKP